MGKGGKMQRICVCSSLQGESRLGIIDNSHLQDIVVPKTLNLVNSAHGKM